MMALFNLPEMGSDEFSLWQILLEKETGLWLPESRKAFLVAALSRYMKEKKLENFNQLYGKFNQGELSLADWASLVDSLTVHETCYYRDNESLQLVINYCRNKALKGFQQESNKAQHLQVWSVGCSTGEEAYTLAIEMDKLNVGLKESCNNSVYFGVVGYDISYPSLAVAREGIYAARQLEFMPEASKNFYFHRLADGYFQVKDIIRQRTCFIQSNVLDLDDKINQEFDVIYCQNVLIYFRNQVKQQVINQLTKRLKPGGILVLGHGEITNIENPELIRVDNKQCLAYLRSVIAEE
jgi:type IV pilus assembly protein PilK